MLPATHKLRTKTKNPQITSALSNPKHPQMNPFIPPKEISRGSGVRASLTHWPGTPSASSAKLLSLKIRAGSNLPISWFEYAGISKRYLDSEV